MIESESGWRAGVTEGMSSESCWFVLFGFSMNVTGCSAEVGAAEVGR